MSKNRMEAFSDGVIAILITIMVLELKVPHGDTPRDLVPLIPIFVSYALSFIFIAIYWNNHHHMLQAVECVHGGVLWANCHLLFWLSLIPFTTAWMGENHFSLWPVFFYGLVLLGSGMAYYVLAHLLMRFHGKDSKLSVALGSDFKGKISVVIYAVALGLAFLSPWLAYACYVFVAAMWLFPDQRIERALNEDCDK